MIFYYYHLFFVLFFCSQAFISSFKNCDVYVILGYSLLDLQKELGKEQERALYLDADNKRKIDILSCNYSTYNYSKCNMDA